MSKLTKSMIPGYGANPTKPNSNPLSGLAPDPETGLPKGLPSGVGKIALRASNPVGGIGPDINGDIGYQKGWLDQSSNGTPAAPPKGPGYNVWADPDMTQRGWGWGMGADGALHQGVHGGGPAGTAWGPQGATPGAGATPVMGATPGAGATPQGMTPLGPGGLRGLVNTGQQLAAQMRAGQGQTAMPGQMGQPGPAMAPGGPQGGPPMGMQPQGAPGPQMGPMGPGQNPQAMQQLIAQLRAQQQGSGQGAAMPGQTAVQ